MRRLLEVHQLPLMRSEWGLRRLLIKRILIALWLFQTDNHFAFRRSFIRLSAFIWLLFHFQNRSRWTEGYLSSPQAFLLNAAGHTEAIFLDLRTCAHVVCVCVCKNHLENVNKTFRYQGIKDTSFFKVSYESVSNCLLSFKRHSHLPHKLPWEKDDCIFRQSKFL